MRICVQVLKSEDRGKNSDNRKAIRIRSNPHGLDLLGTRDALTSSGKVPDLANLHKELCYLAELEVQRKGTTRSATPQGQPQVSAALCSDILETGSNPNQLSQEPTVAGVVLARKLTHLKTKKGRYFCLSPLVMSRNCFLKCFVRLCPPHCSPIVLIGQNTLQVT